VLLAPKTKMVPSAHGFKGPEGSNDAPAIGKRGTYEAGSRSTARSKKMAQEPGRPGGSVENRRLEARETRAMSRMRPGVGGPCSSGEAGERVTTDPVERRGARVGSNFRRET